MNERTSYSHSIKRIDQNVRETSKDAYSDHVISGRNNTETQVTFSALLKLGKANRKMLSRATGFEINKITEYAKRIILAEKARELPEKEKCPISGRRTYFLVPYQKNIWKQGNLFRHE